MWADVFAKVGGGVGGHDEQLRYRKGGNGLTRVYGIEPNPQSAAALRQRVKEVGLEGVYEVVPVGIESINDPTAWDGRIEPGTVDSIVTILCLCSIPEPEKNIKLLYESLKKGGRWYAYEHVQVEQGGFLLRAYQCKLTMLLCFSRINADIARAHKYRLVTSHGFMSHVPSHGQDIKRGWAMGKD
jgi:SAM-dependent methyltransferase